MSITILIRILNTAVPLTFIYYDNIEALFSFLVVVVVVVLFICVIEFSISLLFMRAILPNTISNHSSLSVISVVGTLSTKLVFLTESPVASRT